MAVRLLDLRNGFGLSNTNVCYFNGRIFSLSDDDMPYVVRATEDGDLVTVRRYTIPSRHNMCAHPKFDPLTGDLFALSLNFPAFVARRHFAGQGIIKVDLSCPQGISAIVARRHFAGKGRYGREPCFVPAKGAVSEDDKESGASHFLIMDARSPSLEVIAEVELPSRFLTPEQMANCSAIHVKPVGLDRSRVASTLSTEKSKHVGSAVSQ